MKNIKTFEQFINESTGNFTYLDAMYDADSTESKEKRGIAKVLSHLGAKELNELVLVADSQEDDKIADLDKEKLGFTEVKIKSDMYDYAYIGKWKGKPGVIFTDYSDTFVYVKK